LAIAIRTVRVGSGTYASSAWRTIGASVPSTSSRIALRAGSARSTSSAPERAGPQGTLTVLRPMDGPRRLLALAVIGTAAGIFSGLFGVGGGTVIVPLLILWLAYGEREATGTSLAAIVVIAAAATLTQGAYGNVHVLKGLLVGVPAVGGVVAGTWLQQRVEQETVSLLFAGLLVVSAIVLLVP
jgi:uncharacterized membrane protein YfcA